jgi:hypothetical protein
VNAKLLGLAFTLAGLALAGCEAKSSLDGSKAEMMTVEGRKFEVRLASTGTPDDYRLMVVRATLVINPDVEAERARAQNVARQVMDRTCKGRRYQVTEDNLVDNVNYHTRFRCLT